MNGGTVYVDWKGHRNDQLNDARDLAVTTDFRDVFAEVAVKHLGVKDAGKLFPNYTISKANLRGYLG